MEVTIRYNDSFWYFSQLFDIPLLLIENSNPQINAKQLPIGGRIQIPGYMLKEYDIKEDDSFWEIAITNNIPMDALFLVNPFVDQYTLKVGQTIHIPQRVNDLLITKVEQYTYEKMLQDLGQLQEVYPFLFSQSIGQSVLGKELVEIKVGNGKKQVHLNGSFHANEWITTPVIMQFLNQYAMSLTNNISIRGIYMLPLYIDTTLSLVPMVNPDGVNLVLNGSAAAGIYQQEVRQINNYCDDFSNWKANIKGVDLNKQFPALWEVEAARKPTSPEPRDFPGHKPFSEPESIAMAELARTRKFDRLNAFHTQGKEIYWGFEGYTPPTSKIIVEEYKRVSGYLPVRYIDNYAGYKDWYMQEYQKSGFTIELGIGVNPLPIEQYPEIYQESLGIMLANLYL
ncbi:M14 family metallopeptidase [Virgibacillus ndiopensis]|uniref:M14 family metallopeptidase n=1 Tax=Virgibacillus ndiopensis TaxID=2004408 RepID=UPI000C0878F2|nr:M14 family metallopeptidase [Virgibacillus ndiopensis]